MRNYFLSIGLYIIFVSSLSGQIWAPTNGPSGLELSDFVLSSDDVWVASATSQGIYFSYDKGTTWIKKSVGLYRSNSYATSLAAGPDGIIYALIDDELYRLEKDMDEWDKTIHKFEDGKLYANPNGTLFVVQSFFYSSIFISIDKGIHFKSILPSTIERIGNVSLNGNNNNYIIDQSGTEDKLMRISDDGKTITTLRTLTFSFIDLFWHPDGKLFLYNPFEGLLRFDSTGKLERTIKNISFIRGGIFVKPNADILAIDSDDVYSSSDLGDNWVKSGTNLNNLTSNSFLAFMDDNTIINYSIYCNSISLQSSVDDGNNWLDHSGKFMNLSYKDLSINNATHTIYSLNCSDHFINYSSNKGISWHKLPIPFQYYENFHFSSSGMLFLNNYSQCVMSDDHGVNWTNCSIPAENQIKRIAGDNNLHFLAQSDLDSYISIDGAKSWKKVMTNLNGDVSKIFAHPSGTLFALTNDFSRTAVYLSEDFGLNWSQSNLTFDYTFNFLILKNGMILISGYNSSTSEYGIFISDDKLNTYSFVSSESLERIVEDNSGNLYGFGSYAICMISRDKGKSWTPYTSGLPIPNQVGVYDITGALEIDADQYLYLGLNNNVVFKTINPVTSVSQPTKSELQITLQNNIVDQYLFLKNKAETLKVNSISVVDQMGRIFTNLKTPIFESGLIKLDVNQLNCGIYFLNVQTEDGNNTIHKFIKTR